MDIALIIIFVFAPVPLFHFWLHAMLPFWRKNPFLFYPFCIINWTASFFILKAFSENSSFVYQPNEFFILIGFLFVLVGAILMGSSILTIGTKRFFMWAVLKPSTVEQKRIFSGFFKVIPHPAYIGQILISLGVFIFSGKAYLILVFIYFISLMPIVIYFEEKEMSERIKINNK